MVINGSRAPIQNRFNTSAANSGAKAERGLHCWNRMAIRPEIVGMCAIEPLTSFGGLRVTLHAPGMHLRALSNLCLK